MLRSDLLISLHGEQSSIGGKAHCRQPVPDSTPKWPLPASARGAGPGFPGDGGRRRGRAVHLAQPEDHGGLRQGSQGAAVVLLRELGAALRRGFAVPKRRTHIASKDVEYVRSLVRSH